MTTSFISKSEVVKLNQILGCRDYIVCYYHYSGECAVRPYVNTDTRKFIPTYDKPPDTVLSHPGRILIQYRI